MTYYDPQNQNPVCCCARCQAEIYPGNTCYPIDGWQVLCSECHDEVGETGGIFEYAGYDDETTIHVKENQFGEE